MIVSMFSFQAKNPPVDPLDLSQPTAFLLLSAAPEAAALPLLVEENKSEPTQPEHHLGL